MKNVTDEQRDMALNFLLHRMSQDTRHDLMRSLPMAYVALFPGTASAVVQAVHAGLGNPWPTLDGE